MSTSYIKQLVVFVLLILMRLPSGASELEQFLPSDTIDHVEAYDKRLRFAPSTVVILDRESIELSGALNLGELLERVVGVHITRKFYGSSADKYVRGNGGNWIILHNGVEIERTLPELFGIPVADIERLEILKGSHFAVYGPSAIVGTINLVTFGHGDAGAISARAGTLSTSEAWIRNSYQFDNVRLSGFLYHSETDGTDEVIERDRQTEIDEQLNTQASFAPSQGFFNRTVTDARLTVDIGDRWTINQYITARSAGVGIGIVQSVDPRGSENLERFTTDIRYTREFDHSALDVRFTYNNVAASFDDLFLFPPGTLGGLFPEGVVQSYGQTGEEVTLSASTSFDYKTHAIELKVGGRAGTVKNDYDRRNYVTQNGSPIPVPAGPVQEYFDNDAIFDKELTESNTYLLVRDQTRLSDDFNLDLGIRIDHSTEYGTVVNPRIGLEWSAGQYTDLVILYGESSIVPTIIQKTSNGLFSPLGNDSLEPAQMKTFEIAGTLRYSKYVTLNSSVFIYKQFDDIGSVDDPDSPNGSRFENLQTTETGYGADFTIEFSKSKYLDLRFGLGISHSDTTNEEQTIAPSVLPYFESTYRSDSGWKANLSVFGVFDRQRDAEGGDTRKEIDDYVITNISLISKELLPNTKFTIDAQNIFDVDAREDVAFEITNDVPVWPQRFLLGFKSFF